jgi:hypothetical protein
MEQRFKELFEDLEETHRNRKAQMTEETRNYAEAIKQEEKEEHSWGNGRYLTFR